MTPTPSTGRRSDELATSCKAPNIRFSPLRRRPEENRPQKTPQS
jgi:hypothetical protein